MKTFCIQTLGCKVNQYETEQVATLLRSRGLSQSSADDADLRIVNTCSVTIQAASQSRQSVRQMIRRKDPSLSSLTPPSSQPRVVVIGCWATSDKAVAAAMEGVDAVLTHQHDLAAELERLLSVWQSQSRLRQAAQTCATAAPTRPTTNDGWILKAGTAPDNRTTANKPKSAKNVNQISLKVLSNSDRGSGFPACTSSSEQAGKPAPQPALGASSLPLLGEHQSGRQRAFLKVQDGCDAHCTYCIIPRLRPALWSKPIEQAVEEAKRLVDAGHVEIVLTGIFLGAYGQPTALRRRQPNVDAPPLAKLVDALSRNVPGLKRLRLSSLEPGDLSEALLATLCDHSQVVPHFHLPLQSGSDLILRRMNRQYNRDDFLQMVDRVYDRFDRPALTTDIIVGFPGENDFEFEQTLQVARRARFIHVHAFPYSPRPGTAAARWKDQFVHGPIVNNRIDQLRHDAADYSLQYRRNFVGEVVEVIAERDREIQDEVATRQGRCERYFTVHFEAPDAKAGQMLPVRITTVTPTRTFGEVCR